MIVVGICLTACIGLGWTIHYQNKIIDELQFDLKHAVNNNIAYEEANSYLKDRIVAFQLTTDQLTYSKDSLTHKLDSIRRVIGVKDKQIKQLQYLASENRKRDTILVKGDPIFVQDAVLDTTIRDAWSSLTLHAEYPNLIETEFAFWNSTAIVVHDSRVTIKPPKKCWIGRLFQKKQTIVEIDVLQENPYCVNKNQKFIEIIEK